MLLPPKYIGAEQGGTMPSSLELIPSAGHRTCRRLCWFAMHPLRSPESAAFVLGRVGLAISAQGLPAVAGCGLSP